MGACAAPAPDTILVNGRIFTANPEQPWAEALAVRGERIVGVGDDATISGAAGDRTVRVALGGRTVVPGFNDAHLRMSDASVDAARRLGADALAQGLTSIQVYAAGAVSDTVRAFREADHPLRIRVARMPMPDASGVNRDSRPFFPPQPGPRLDVRGMGFELGGADTGRLQQAVGWAYGTEDPLAVRPLDSPTVEAYIAALEAHGAADVWRAKRPRLERPQVLPENAGQRLQRLGVVIVQAPGQGVPLQSVLAAGLPLALASGESSGGFAVIARATRASLADERLTWEEAVTAYTRGSARAESTDAQKGHLSVGAFADLSVQSADGTSSVLTMIGGRLVYNVLRP